MNVLAFHSTDTFFPSKKNQVSRLQNKAHTDLHCRTRSCKRQRLVTSPSGQERINCFLGVYISNLINVKPHKKACSPVMTDCMANQFIKARLFDNVFNEIFCVSAIQVRNIAARVCLQATCSSFHLC